MGNRGLWQEAEWNIQEMCKYGSDESGRVGKYRPCTTCSSSICLPFTTWLWFSTPFQCPTKISSSNWRTGWLDERVTILSLCFFLHQGKQLSLNMWTSEGNNYTFHRIEEYWVERKSSQLTYDLSSRHWAGFSERTTSLEWRLYLSSKKGYTSYLLFQLT